ncbi:ABC transporter ATP-binding protein [Teredinibacter sp. KSP-S5-2]|uniref:ABC transporter ATP-binding protein n=1 Tax=Teredinibacter sp. KSP-S5-2 TaxID=3034506 RepID=UPI002934A093|nr:ABC transporter ATP-binding protein [Teredinibacter sp. KSP-S5-2]WNO08765.1 ABC transporter ATP-binding protein [Teredinibacter sp. KSP-S5-2]
MFGFFEKLVAPFPSNDPEQPPSSLVAFCLHYCKGSGRYLFLMALLTGAIAILEVSLFDFLGELIDILNSSKPETLLSEHSSLFVTYGTVVLVLLPISVLIRSLVVHQTLLGNFPMRIRWQAHRHLLGQSMSFYQHEFAGRVATKVMQTSLSVRESVMKLLDVLLYILIYFSSVVVLAASLDLRLALPLIGWLIAYCTILYYFLPRLKNIAQRQADARSEMTGRIVDTYTNISTVKLFSHSRREENYAKEGMKNFLTTVYPQMRLATGLDVIVWLSNAGLIASTVFISVWRWMEGSITTGAIAAAIALVLRLYSISQWVMWEISGLFESIGTTTDGMNTLSQPKEVQDTPQSNPIQLTQGAISFTHACFHYGKGSGVIDDLNIDIKPGEKIGLVGRSGAGKSTLVNLLLRFYDVEQGTVTIDGQNVSDVQQESLRAQIAMVTQDTSLLHRSVRENILYGKPDATDEEMIEAAKQAKAHEFILGLSDPSGRTGYDAHVGERGVTLSGGQRQRIAIARVLLKNAPILILDEATSALDSEVETAIQENLYKLMEGKTVIAIAHRLSTIAALDRLIVMDKGNIIEQGSHQELIKQKGTYAQLWAHQSGGFLGEN